MAIVTYAHGPLTKLASNLWLVSAPTSQALDRKMTVVRGDDGGLLLFDALWLDEERFSELDRIGTVRTIFVPCFLHDFDGERFAERYPDARLCGMPGTVKKLAWPRLVPFEPAFAPACADVRRVPGLKMGEVYVEVRHPEGGASLVFNDALFNLPHSGGFRGFIVRMIGSSGPLHMTPLGRMFLLADRAAFRAFLVEQAARKDLRALIVGHGETITENVGERIGEAAARL